jgi:hypothetical protein
MKLALTPSSASRSQGPGFRHLGLAALCAIALLGAPVASAADGPPPLMSFQTRILDSGGNPIPNGTKEVFFRVYGSESGAGAILWSEKQTVAVKDGYVSVILGQGGAVPGEANGDLSALFTGTGDTERYIEVELDSTKISPRLRLLPTAYSFVSGVALKLVANSITTGMLRDNAVGNAALANGSVTTGKLDDQAVTQQKIAAGAVSNGKIEDNAVTSAKINDGAVGNADLANNAVTGAKIQDGAVGSSDLGDGSVTTAKLADGAVTSAKIANESITTDDIKDGNINWWDIANDAVLSTKLQGGMFYTVTYNYNDQTSGYTYNSGWGANDWYPVLSSLYLGSGDIDEGGSGQLLSVRFWIQGGYWYFRFFERTHGNHADPIVRVLFIPKRLVNGSFINFGAWQE